jgi:hypothetical protein
MTIIRATDMKVGGKYKISLTGVVDYIAQGGGAFNIKDSGTNGRSRMLDPQGWTIERILPDVKDGDVWVAGTWAFMADNTKCVMTRYTGYTLSYELFFDKYPSATRIHRER